MNDETQTAEAPEAIQPVVVPPEERGPEYQDPYDESDREVLANSYYALARGAWSAGGGGGVVLIGCLSVISRPAVLADGITLFEVYSR
jgi:hypothetical protein